MAKKTTQRQQTAKPTPDRTERALSAALKKHRGEPLSQRESRDLTWWEKEQRDRVVDDLLTTLPKGIYCDLAGRQQKLVDEFAERYGVPCDGPTVNLYRAVNAMHDLIVENAHLLAADMDEDQVKLQHEKLRQEVLQLQKRNERLAIQIEADRGEVVYKSELREALSWLSLRLRALGRQLQKSKTGNDAQKTLNEFLEQLAKEIEVGRLAV